MVARELRLPVHARLGAVGPGSEGDLELAAVGLYRGVWGRIVRAYKEDPVPMVATVVLPRFHALARADGDRALAEWAAEPVLVPVPMAKTRRRQRGFNPPEGLALELGAKLGWSCRPSALRRVRYRRPLRGLSETERRAEMAAAFQAGEIEELAGRPVILIDDVVTTGSTLRAAAEALRRCGVPVVRAWCLGRTPRRHARRHASDRRSGAGD